MGFPSWGVLNAAMLLGLLGAAVPVVIHFLNRRRDEVLDWGAMQFLEPGRRARRKVRLTELLLMLARMAVLAVVALGLARPFWTPPASAQGVEKRDDRGPMADKAAPRDVVIVLDGSDSMERKVGGTTPRALAVRWARGFARRLRPGDSVAILVAGDRVRPLIDPPSFDTAKIDAALAGIKSSRGSSDLPAALGEAFRVLERTRNPERDVLLLTDGQRFAWRAGDARRWALVRDLRRRLPVPPRLWSVAFGNGLTPDAPNGSVGPLSVSRALLTPRLPVRVTTAVSNAGPGPLTRTAELLIDGHPALDSSQAVGPVPAGGTTPVVFRTALPDPGAHLLTVRLVGGADSLPGDDEASVPVAVQDALPVLLVDGEPGLEPLSGETDFLRAALAPTGDDTPQIRATTINLDKFTAESFKNQAVAVLANVDRLAPEQVGALGRFLDGGGGLLVAPGDKTDADFWNNLGIAPAKLGDLKGDPAGRVVVAHPAPRSFAGPALAPFGEGESPPLAGAGFFAYRLLTPAPGASVSARLDTGDPWAVERAQGPGRVLLLATSLDAEGGTLPVNPDFVPLVHEWVFHLAGSSSAPRPLSAGEPLIFDVGPPPPESVHSLPLTLPDGATVSVPLVRTSGSCRVRHDDTSRPGVYRLTLPAGALYAVVAADPREADLSPLGPAEAARLSEAWPLVIETDPGRLTTRLFESGRGGKHEVWRLLVLAALGGLCVEIWLTRKLVRSQGTAGVY